MNYLVEIPGNAEFGQTQLKDYGHALFVTYSVDDIKYVVVIAKEGSVFSGEPREV